MNKNDKQEFTSGQAVYVKAMFEAIDSAGDATLRVAYLGGASKHAGADPATVYDAAEINRALALASIVRPEVVDREAMREVLRTALLSPSGMEAILDAALNVVYRAPTPEYRGFGGGDKQREG